MYHPIIMVQNVLLDVVCLLTKVFLTMCVCVYDKYPL